MNPLNIESHTLKNGLQVHFCLDQRSPVIYSQIWYRVGSVYEPNGLTGISHMLEHMMFKGTHKMPYGQLEDTVEQLGGEQNAFTSHDFTCYYQYWHKKNLHQSLSIEADRMSNLIFDESLFIKERAVVMEERRLRTDDSPIGLAFEYLSALVFQKTPRRNPIIGWMEDIEQYQLSDIQRWYKTWYHPNNAHLVIAGDFDTTEALQYIQQQFETMQHDPQQTPHHYKIPIRESTRTHRHINLTHSNTQVPTLFMAFVAPSFKTSENLSEVAALTALNKILTENHSAILNQHLIRQQEKVTEIQSDYDPYALQDTLFYFIALPTPEHTLTDIENTLIVEISNLKTSGIDTKLLSAVKQNILAELTFLQDSLEQKALLIGMLKCYDLHNSHLAQYYHAISTLTPEDVMSVFSKYIDPQYRNTLYLTPTITKNVDTPK